MTGPPRFPASGLWSIAGPLQDLALLGVDLAARIAAGLEFGSLPLPRGAVLYAADYATARFQNRLAEWSHYHAAALEFEVAHVPAPAGGGHTLAHHVREVGPVAIIVDSPPPDRLLMAGLRSLAMRFGVLVLCASPVALPGVPILLRLERTEGRSGQITLETAFGGRTVATYSVTTSQQAGHGVPMLEMTAPESNTSPEPRKRPASAQAMDDAPCCHGRGRSAHPRPEPTPPTARRPCPDSGC